MPKIWRNESDSNSYTANQAMGYHEYVYVYWWIAMGKFNRTYFGIPCKEAIK